MEADMYHAAQNIPGCPGFSATADGDIIKNSTGKLKRQRPAANGALQVDIGNTTRKVHDLVARAFHGDAPAGYRAKHVNGDLTDNRADNLYWCGSPSDNATQQPSTSLEIEREYERIENDRLSLIELMQT